MIWKDRDINLKILYYNISNKCRYDVLSDNIKEIKDKIEKLAFMNGVYISLNNTVICTNNYLVIGILYVNDYCNIDKILDEISVLIETTKKENCLSKYIYETKTVKEFNKFINNLNNIDASFCANLQNSTKQNFVNKWCEYTSVNLRNKIRINLNRIDPNSKKLFDSDKKYFMGLCLYCKEGIKLKSIFILNILKESIGDNDTDSVFFGMRKRGDIYSGYSKVFFDTNTLLSGCFAGYSYKLCKEIREEILNRVNLLCFDTLELDKFKKKYINYFKILNLEYHKGYLIEPYFRYFHEIKEFEDIIGVVESIEVEDINSFVNEVEYMDVVLEI